jgi:hypothetical protein
MVDVIFSLPWGIGAGDVWLVKEAQFSILTNWPSGMKRRTLLWHLPSLVFF